MHAKEQKMTLHPSHSIKHSHLHVYPNYFQSMGDMLDVNTQNYEYFATDN